ncbi:DinB family protein [Flavobacterium terrisoli]|uniref:DinB family protein n=1 Tax=Flavobacterium terrisoli TaxID=3242195 RepID=UPI002543DCAA|nr:DinB family protein [Flavobacterium buctense]
MNPTQTMVKMTFDRWNALIKQFDDTLNNLTDEQLQKEIAPGKNRGIYLLGHLIAVHDDMIRLLDFGNKLYPELYEPFITESDKSVVELPTAVDLRAKWNRMNQVLNQKFSQLQPEQWFEKHTAVTAEEFVNEPHRNKLNIMVTRTSHLAWHTGQFILLK